MSALGIAIGSGINVGGGINVGAGGGSPPPGILTFTYSQIIAIEDTSTGAGGNGTGVVIVNPVVGLGTGPGIACSTTSAQQTTISGLTPVPGYTGGSGPPLLYTATWSAGSTYLTTPVQVEFHPTGFGLNANVWVLYVLNPSATAGQTGTFNFPVTLAATPNTTSTFV